MTVKLSSLRVTAEMDASSYVAAAAQKEAADKKMVSSSVEVGRALAAQDAVAQKLGVGVASLSRSYIEGYGPASKFEQAVRSLGASLDRGLDAGRAVAIYAGISTSFKQTADAAQLIQRNMVSLAPVVAAVNEKLSLQAEIQKRVREEAERSSRVQQSQSSFNAQLGAAGVGRQSPAYTPDRLAVLEKEAQRQDQAAQAAYQDSLRAEIARREAVGGALARNINDRMGFARPDPKGAEASQSASVFEAAFSQEQKKVAADLDARAKSILNSHIPLTAELRRHREFQKEIVELGKARVLTEQQVAQALGAETLRYEQAKNSIQGMYIVQGKYASGVGLARNELVNLSRQLQDVAVTLQAGQPLSTILLQQGTQIADIFTSSRATMAGFFSQAARGVAGFATSLAGVVTGLAAAGVGAVYLGTKFADGQREVERYLSGIGRVSGATVASVNAVATALASQQRISVNAAREVASIGAGGGVRNENLGQFSGVTRNYAAQTGQDLAAAAGEIAKALADPTKGVETLNDKLGFLDAKTKEYIRTLQNQGNTSGAQKAVLDAMSDSVQGAADRISFLAKTWQNLNNVISNVADGIGAALNNQITLEDKLFAAQTRRAAQERDALNRLFGRKADTSDADTEIRLLQAQIDLEKRLADEKTRTARANQLSLKNDELVKNVTGDIEKIKELKAALDALARGQGGNNTEGFARTYDAVASALGTALTNMQRIRAESELSVRSTLARTLGEQQSVAAERERLSMAGQSIDAAERELRVKKAILDVQVQATREARDAARSANDNFSLAGLLPYQRAMQQIKIDMRELRTRTESTSTTNIPAVGYQNATGMDASFAEKVKKLIAAVDDSGATQTSGFRSREKQQELFDLYGPGRAARPGNSQHEHGTAADYTFSSSEARARAMALASEYGLRALPSNGGAVHFDNGPRGGAPMSQRSFTSYAGAATQANSSLNSFTEAQKKAAVAAEMIDLPLRKASMDLESQNKILDISIATYGKTTFEMNRAAKEQELLNSFIQQGITPTDEMRKRVADLADGYGKLAERQASVKLIQDAMFERQQLSRDDSERGIASRLRGTGIGMDSEIANMLRFNSAIEQGQSLFTSFVSDLKSGAMQGKKGLDVLRDAAKKLFDQLSTMALNSLSRSLFSGIFGGGGGGGLFSSFFGGGATSFGGITGGPISAGTSGTNLLGMLFSAKGNAFSSGNVVPFAKGGILDRPTFFGYGNNQVGVGGEAGTEGILPLKRGRGGVLGVTLNDNTPQRSAGAPTYIINAQGAQIGVAEQITAAIKAYDATLPKKLAQRDAR